MYLTLSCRRPETTAKLLQLCISFLPKRLFLLQSKTDRCTTILWQFFISTPNMVRHDTCWHNYAVKRGLVVSFCGQPHYCYRPYYPTARFRSLSSYMVSDEPFPDRSRPMLCELAQMGSHPITFLCFWQTMNHIVNTLSKFEGRQNLLHKADDDSHMSGICSNCSTRKMIIRVHTPKNNKICEMSRINAMTEVWRNQNSLPHTTVKKIKIRLKANPIVPTPLLKQQHTYKYILNWIPSVY